MLHGAAWDLNDSRILNSIRDFTDNYNTAPRHHATPQIIPREIVCVSLELGQLYRQPPLSWGMPVQTSSSHNCYPRPRESQQSAVSIPLLCFDNFSSASPQPSAWLWEYLLTLSINEIAFYFLWAEWNDPLAAIPFKVCVQMTRYTGGPCVTMQCMAPQISGHSLTYPGQWTRDSDRVQGLLVWHHCEHNMRAVMWAALQESGEGTWINWSPSYSLISSH